MRIKKLVAGRLKMQELKMGRPVNGGPKFSVSSIRVSRVSVMVSVRDSVK